MSPTSSIASREALILPQSLSSFQTVGFRRLADLLEHSRLVDACILMEQRIGNCEGGF